MRFLLLILSLVILFQPASWAMGMPMSPAHQQIGEGMRVDHAGAQSMALIAADVGKHCQTDYDEMILTDGLTNSSHLQENNLPASCHSAPSALSLAEIVAFSFVPQYFGVAYHAPSILFQSRTESPEIRPPHNNIRFQG